MSLNTTDSPERRLSQRPLQRIASPTGEESDPSDPSESDTTSASPNSPVRRTSAFGIEPGLERRTSMARRMSLGGGDASRPLMDFNAYMEERSHRPALGDIMESPCTSLSNSVAGSAHGSLYQSLCSTRAQSQAVSTLGSQY